MTSESDAGNSDSLNGSAGRKLLLRRPQPSPSLGRRVTSEVGGDGEESGEEGAGETMPQVYDTHYFSLAHLFGFKERDLLWWMGGKGQKKAFDEAEVA